MLCYKKHLAETCQSVFIIPVLTSPRKSAVILLSHIRFLASLTCGNKNHMARTHLAQPSRSNTEAWLSSHTGTKAVLKPRGTLKKAPSTPLLPSGNTSLGSIWAASFWHKDALSDQQSQILRHLPLNTLMQGLRHSNSATRSPQLIPVV